jgi:hypothetical protein
MVRTNNFWEGRNKLRNTYKNNNFFFFGKRVNIKKQKIKKKKNI